jgi:predicted amidohydrolase
MYTERLVAAISMTSCPNREANIEQAFQAMEKSAALGAHWILLPEIFNYFGPYKDLYANAEEEGGALFTRISAFAKKHDVVVFAGTVTEKPKGPEQKNDKGESRVYNTLYVFDRNGEMIGKYRKTHLFNLLASDGKPLYCESDGFIPGDELKAIDVDGFRVGLSVCYDLRFPEMFLALAKDRPLDVIVMPSAFTQQTGMDHWEVLLRARAIEQQCYVYAANQVGLHYEQKVCYGHSMIVDPWGIKIADSGATAGIALGEISKKRIAQVRAQLPALKNKRRDLY